MRLADRLGSHDNNFALLRLVAALLVIFGHSFTLLEATPGRPYPADPISFVLRHYAPFQEGLPGIGVHIFFFVSGVLVTRSFMKRTWQEFVTARLLRIVPAYWVSLVVLAFVLGPSASTLPFENYFAHPSLRNFLAYDILFWPMWGALPGVFETLPVAGAVNGPYWTLPLEMQMYGWCMLLGLIGAYRRRWMFAVFLVAIALSCMYFPVPFIFLTEHGEPRLWHFFFLGTLATIYAERIVLRWTVWLLTALPLPIVFFTIPEFYHLYSAIWFCYGLLCVIYLKPLPSLDPSRMGDYSYGLYLYGFPVQQCLVLVLGTSISGWTMFPLALAITLVPAALSWHLVEHPALRFKSRFALSRRGVRPIPVSL